MVLAVVGVVFGLALLTVAADQFVVGAARVAGALRISAVVVGAVVIGFGTSAPEMLVSALASIQGRLDLAVGNIIGSNVANLTLVLGAAALVTPVVVQSPVLRREAPLSLAATVAFALLVQGGMSWVEGTILAIVLVASLTIIIASSRRGDPALSADVEEFLEGPAPSVRKEVVRTVLGLLGTLGAAQLVVMSSTTIATELGLAEGFVGFTIVAVGTSLPELATGLQAARKGEVDLIVGNLLGSNLFNSAAVGTTAAFAGAGQVVDATLTGPGVVVMLTVSVVATWFMVTGRRVVRWEAVVLLLGYLAILPLLAG